MTHEIPVNENFGIATTSNRSSTHKRNMSKEVTELNVKRPKLNDDMAIEELQKAYNDLKAQMQRKTNKQTKTTLPKTAQVRKRTQNVSF